ncbi:threonine/serine dehydratase [Fulvivirgaceae bacterium BMA10]|uniref:Threonine/serine dehydratase n=1 Tax=Splendidivirga corallicola TaxID=3051826 RepID=A0ABT8KJT3_9BACT|nr:threonine/serine dehydratase [Fulvivirgaceae bacterium BMA10]
MNIYDLVNEAEQRIRPYIYETPLEHSPYLSQVIDGEVHLKLESQQRSGSFKYRGITNKLLSLDETVLEKGVITASTGNHAGAFSMILSQLKRKGIIFLPENVSKAKVESLQHFDVELKFYGKDPIETELEAMRFAKENDLVYISPYNDPYILAGQGTVGVELGRQLEEINTVIIPIGGGGLISGIAGYFQGFNPKTEIAGCQPINSPVMYESIRAGKIIEMESLDTLSDGTAGGIEPGSITFDVCQDLVKDYILVSEEEIKQALKLIIEKHQMIVEGAACLSIASLLKEKHKFQGKRVVLIICGRKISLEKLQSVICN